MSTDTTTAEKAAAVFVATEHAEQLIPASRFHRYPSNRIPSSKAISAMRESFLKNGQLQPITARPIIIEGKENLQIIFGETRLLGGRAIDPQHPIRCYIIPMDDKTAARIHAVENFQRKELDPIEEAQAIQNMVETDWKIPAIAETLGITRKTVYARLSLLKLDAETLLAVREGTISLNTAAEIANLDPEDQIKARELCTSPTHSATHLSERDALTQIELTIIRPKKEAAEWNARRPELEQAFPAATFLEFEAAKAAVSSSSSYEPCESTPGWSYLSPAAQNGSIETPTWGELAEKHQAETFLALPPPWDDKKQPRIMVLAEPLIAAEIALVDAGEIAPMDSPFQHPAQRQQAQLQQEKEKALEEQKTQALRTEIKEALLTIARPGAITPAAAERLCIEVFKANQYDFEFQGGNLPGFETEDDEVIEKTATAYLRQKAIRGFEAFGILYVLSKLDLHPTASSARELPALLIGTKSLKEKDFPLLTEQWKEQCAKRLADDEAALAKQGKEEEAQQPRKHNGIPERRRY